MVTTDLQNVFLGIHGGKLCLSCIKSGDNIKLQLEVRIWLSYQTIMKSNSLHQLQMVLMTL